uniref:BHLH domain-containing protein n=1 Tax=Pygocentrus nattereri TaxID=42514 RepID=A0A3B4ENX4_PYGNA
MVLYKTFLKHVPYSINKGFCYCWKLDIGPTEEPFLVLYRTMYNTFSINLRNHFASSFKTPRSAVPKQCEESNIPGCRPRTRTRSKNPSKQRQNASEKEKLRMRDLTKALHHLRSFLPPSVAPAGQTLTKIETLRLTIRYISYLSSQLGLGEEPLCQGGDLGPPRSGMCHYSSIPGAWRSMPGAEAHREAFRPLSHHGMTAAGPQDSMDMAFLSSRDVLDSMLECQMYPDTPFSYQVGTQTISHRLKK